jgi:H+/Cl- antiporter ClcA
MRQAVTRIVRGGSMSVMFLVAGALAGAFWGLVAALVLKWGRKLDRLPRWPILNGAMAGLLIGLIGSLGR